MKVYYNENEPFAARWLENLIEEGHIPHGDVDDRSIEEVSASDLRGYDQCHFFAGIGVWAYALEKASWNKKTKSRQVWTGSCPCQPFSGAGRKKGFKDNRHLWPAWFRLIEKCKPAIVFGEQVANPDGLVWLDLVSSNLEGKGYAFGASDLCAAGVGAPHIRQRLYFVGDASSKRGGRNSRTVSRTKTSSCEERIASRNFSNQLIASGSAHERKTSGPAGPVRGFWKKAEVVDCSDGKSRFVEPGTFPLAHGAPSRVGRLRAYGNALVAPVAETFIRAYLEV